MKFVDTSWWVAWALPEDARHGKAMHMAARVGDRERLLTTNLVLGETWTFPCSLRNAASASASTCT